MCLVPGALVFYGGAGRARDTRDTIQYNTIKNYLNTVKSFSIKKKQTKTDLQDCRVGVTIDIDNNNNHLLLF